MKPQRSHFAALGALSLFAILGGARVAHAAGIEDSVAGAVNLGRAANYVRVNDFMATYQNPANLAIIPGWDLGGELRFPLFQACFDRAKDPNVAAAGGYREPRGSFMGSEHFNTVCNEGKLFPSGNLGWAQSYPKRWGWGVGFFTPAGSPTAKYGDSTNVTLVPLEGEPYPITATGTESPNRYMLLERRAIAGFVMAGLGAQPIPQLRFGLSVGWGFANIYNRNMSSVQGGTFRDQQLINDLHATDWAIPRLTTSVVVAPIDSFEIMAQLTYQGDIEATGHVDLTANGINGAPLRNCRGVGPDGMPNPGPHCRIDDVALRAPLPPLEATIGLRYAKRRTPRGRVLDPMKDEVFDLELNAYWSQTSHVDEYNIRLYNEMPGSPGAPRIAFSGAPGAAALATPQDIVIPRNWQDTYGVRFGGDYNVVPKVFSFRLGYSFETTAVRDRYMNVDFFPVQKMGLHAGLSFILGPQRITLAYSHVMYETVDVAVGTGAVKEIASQAQDRALPVNEGRYQAALDIFSIQSNLSF